MCSVQLVVTSRIFLLLMCAIHVDRLKWHLSGEGLENIGFDELAALQYTPV